MRQDLHINISSRLRARLHGKEAFDPQHGQTEKNSEQNDKGVILGIRIFRDSIHSTNTLKRLKDQDSRDSWHVEDENFKILFYLNDREWRQIRHRAKNALHHCSLSLTDESQPIKGDWLTAATEESYLMSQTNWEISSDNQKVN